MRRFPAETALFALIICLLTSVFGQGTGVRPPSVFGIRGGGMADLGQRIDLTVDIEVQAGVVYRYQWSKGATDILGATQATYVIAAATGADSGSYAVRVSNEAGENAASVTLSVRPAAAPAISAPPRSLSAHVGQTVSFSFTASGSFPRTYQWLRDGSAIPGATLETLELKAITTAAVGAYSVTVTNSLGSITSTAALLTVNAATPVVLSSRYPEDASHIEGSSVVLQSALEGGSGPYTYQWFKAGVPIGGATEELLRFDAIHPGDAGVYSVRVSNILGAATSRSATITVLPATPVSITSQPRAVAVFETETAIFSVSATGTAVRYQWHKDGVPIANATGSSYRIGEVRPSDAGSYTVVVSNIRGSVTSFPAALTIKPAELPVITSQFQDIQTVEGRTIETAVSATGSPTLRYQWYINDVAVPGATGAWFIHTVLLSDTGTLHVVVTNAAGSVKSRAIRLTVEAMAPPGGANIVVSESTINGATRMTAYHSDIASVQWYKDGAPIPGATTQHYDLRQTTPEAAGDYFVVLTNAGGSTASHTKRVYANQPGTPPAGSWMAAERSGDIVYFAFANPARIERYHLPSESWLGAIQLPRSPSALAVGTSGIYLANGTSVYRYSLQGTGEITFATGFTSLRTITLHREYLLVGYRDLDSTTLATIRLSDGRQVARQFYSSFRVTSPNIVSAPTLGAVFLRANFDGLIRINVGADGSLPSSFSRSPDLIYVTPNSYLYLKPDESTIVDSGGTTFRLSDTENIPGIEPFDDIAFRPSGEYVALRGGRLYHHNAQGFETGQVSAGIAVARKVIVHGDTAYAFAPPVGGASISIGKASLAPASSASAASRIDGAAVSFVPAATLVDRNGVLLLYSKTLRQVFRWSTAERRFLSSVPLRGWPNAIAYSAALDRLYLGYDDSRVTQVALDASEPLEQPFAVAPRAVTGMLLTPYSLLTFSLTGLGCSLHPATGELLWGMPVNAGDSGLKPHSTWSPALNRIYFFAPPSNSIFWSEIRPDGTLGGGATRSTSDLTHREPYRISPDGGALLTGNGRFYDPTTLIANNALPHSIRDALWLGRTLYTARSLGASVAVTRHGGSNYGEDAARTVPGRFLHLLELPAQRLAVITLQAGAPLITVLDAGLTVVSSEFAGAPTRLANLAARATVGQGDQILIPGFVIGGVRPKRVLIRAAGPALAGFGVTGALSDPAMEVLDASNAVVAANDNWDTAANRAELVAAASTVGAFAFAPGSRDAAALVTLPPGAYTVRTTGVGEATGIALVELYDVPEAGNTSRLVNIAARAQVGTGANILIPGIVIQGTAPKTVLVRAAGPSLARFGVAGTLAGARLRIYHGETLLHENANWGDAQNASQIAAAASHVGAFALNNKSRDAALLVVLAPGSYTAQVSGDTGGSGVALVEVYEVNN